MRASSSLKTPMLHEHFISWSNGHCFIRNRIFTAFIDHLSIPCPSYLQPHPVRYNQAPGRVTQAHISVQIIWTHQTLFFLNVKGNIFNRQRTKHLLFSSGIYKRLWSEAKAREILLLVTLGWREGGRGGGAGWRGVWMAEKGEGKKLQKLLTSRWRQHNVWGAPPLQPFGFVDSSSNIDRCFIL